MSDIYPLNLSTTLYASIDTNICPLILLRNNSMPTYYLVISSVCTHKGVMMDVEWEDSLKMKKEIDYYIMSLIL